jgi:RNA polymerase sigma factor (sigma-70 family)
VSADAEPDGRWLAFEAEALPHADRLFRHAMWLAGNRAEAEDLVQETMVQALQSFHRFTPSTNCRAWLVTILQHVRSNRLRKQGRVIVDSALEERAANVVPFVPPIPDRLTDEDMLLAGDRVRVSAQLVETPQGTLRWTTTALAIFDDMFRVLDGLVRRIVESLALPLTVREARGLEHDVPGSGHAFELYLRANRLGRYPETWPQARDLYLESVRADARYAPAWARLGRTYRMMAKYGGGGRCTVGAPG